MTHDQCRGCRAEMTTVHELEREYCDSCFHRSPKAVGQELAAWIPTQFAKLRDEQEHLRRRDLFERIVCAVASNPRMKTPLAIITLANELLARTLEKEER